MDRLETKLDTTPKTPKGLPSRVRPEINLTPNARVVLEKRYLRRGPDGKPAESPEEMFDRVARTVAAPDTRYGADALATRERFYELLTSLRFFPNSPTFTGADTPLGQLAACFVLPIIDDMGRDPQGIFSTLRAAALVQQTGGGNGFSFSRLRPRGDRVQASGGVASGPVGFLRVYDTAFGEVAQGGCLLPETLVFTGNGLLRLDEIADSQIQGWQSHMLQVATDQGWRASPRAYNNGVAPILRVHTREGLSLGGTPEHRVRVMTDEGPRWRKLEELDPGDWIVVQLAQQRGRMQTLRQPARMHFNQVMPQFRMVLDEELAFFVGCLVGDGFVATQEDDHRVGVSVAHTSYLMEEMPNLLTRLFGVTGHRQQKPDDRSVTFVLDNRAVKEFLYLNGLAKARSRDAVVPRLIRQSPPEVVGAFLRGLFEADGSLSSGYPNLTTASPRLTEEVATLLIGLGCPVRIRSVTPGVTHFGKNAIYHVRISSSVGLKAWRDRIGCDPRSRFAAAMAWESDLRRESTYVLPHARYWLQSVLDAITLEQVDARGRGMGINFRSREPRLRRALLRYIRGDRELTRSTWDQLRECYPVFADTATALNDQWFVQVAGVEPQGEAITLDLEVDENHTYLAYGMVTHNTRRGANMAVLRVDHPDVYDFIGCKETEGAISNFNISVGITDAFMRAVENDEDFELVNPRDGKVTRTVRARELFDEIVKHAHRNGEPGALFLDAANRANPVPHLYELESTNPCGEQFLGPYENCCLGSINLAQHITRDNKLDWAKLRESVELSTRFLDNVVDANKYVPAVPELAQAAHRARRIGLGIMGLGDVMYRIGARYGSSAGEDLAGQIMEFVRFHAMKTSIELARTRGAFPAIKGSLYDPENLKWSPPKPLEPFTQNWNRPAIDWNEIVAGIKKYGIRNAAQTTIAPTGTIATVAGDESYGCEPVFALAYTRHVNDGGKDLQLDYVSPLFERALIDAGVDEAARQKIFERVRLTGTCQDVDLVPEKVRDIFVVASDIIPEEHVRMQAAMQAFVDNSLSKTVNFPETATVPEVEEAYFLAWKLGCKGITVYVAGTREQVVLETQETAAKKGNKVTDPASFSGGKEGTEGNTEFVVAQKKPRSHALIGQTYKIETPLGTAYVTVNRNGENQPFEVFCNIGKAGSDTAAVSEAIGRLISLALRMPSPLSPTERLQEVVAQLSGIGGGRPMGFGLQRVRSLPDGIAQVLAEDLGKPRVVAVHHDDHESKQLQLFRVGDLCPACGQASLVSEEGCRRCYSCGHSEC